MAVQSMIYRRGRRLSVPQVARRLSVSESTVYRLIGSGELEAVRVGRKAWRVSEATLVRFVASRSNRADEGMKRQKRRAEGPGRS